jgi:uncharacterized protein (TIGR03435 family)
VFGFPKRLLAVAVPAAALIAVAQQPARREFEVASIKPNNSGPPLIQTNRFSYSQGGLFKATNVTLVDIIVSGVYQTRRIQMRGGPDWIDSQRFDIAAKADTTGGEVTPEQWTQMIQALLEDRFKLVLHRETKEMPVYALVGGKNPPGMQPSKDGEESVFKPGDRGQMIFQRMSVVALVNTLANILHEPVVDGTGIAGFFDFTLDPMQFATNSDGRPPDAFPDLVLTAVREQLGFRLERRTAPLEITIIDRAEKPGDN